MDDEPADYTGKIKAKTVDQIIERKALGFSKKPKMVCRPKMIQERRPKCLVDNAQRRS
jgi:hypothetical protein